MIIKFRPTKQIYGRAHNLFLGKHPFQWFDNYKDSIECFFSEEEAKEIIELHRLSQEGAVILPKKVRLSCS